MQIGKIIAGKIASWVGVPFKYRGKNRFGCDCAGLLVGLLEENNIHNSFVEIYNNHKSGNYIDGEKLQYAIESCTKSIALNAAKCGDIILFSMARNQANHLAIISRINPIYIVHSTHNAGKTVENILDETLISKIKSVATFQL
jgi:hypothetical protein